MDMQAGPAVVLTREPEDNRELAEVLRARGVPVFEIPCIATRVVVPENLPEGPVDSVVFTSRRGVQGLLRQGESARLLWGLAGANQNKRPGAIVAAVGAATARALEASGLRVDVVADPPEGALLARLMIPLLKPGARIVLVRGNLRTGGLDTALEDAGFVLEPVVVYENVSPEIPVCAPFPVAAVFVASPSAAERLVNRNPWIREYPFFTTGATTDRALRDLGISQVETIGARSEDWVEVLCAAYRRSKDLEDR